MSCQAERIVAESHPGRLTEILGSRSTSCAPRPDLVCQTIFPFLNPPADQMPSRIPSPSPLHHQNPQSEQAAQVAWGVSPVNTVVQPRDPTTSPPVVLNAQQSPSIYGPSGSRFRCPKSDVWKTSCQADFWYPPVILPGPRTREPRSQVEVDCLNGYSPEQRTIICYAEIGRVSASARSFIQNRSAHDSEEGTGIIGRLAVVQHSRSYNLHQIV